jgi:Ca2+/H+ antiporter
MTGARTFTKNQVIVYWALIAVAPFSVFTTATHTPPVFVWLFFSLGLVASLNRVRHSVRKAAKSLAAITSALYGGLVMFLIYTNAPSLFT